MAIDIFEKRRNIQQVQGRPDPEPVRYEIYAPLFYRTLFLLLFTAVPIRVPPTNSRAIQSGTPLFSPVHGDFASFGSFAVTVSAFVISFVAAASA